MTISIAKQQSPLPGIITAPPALAFYDPAEIQVHVEVESEYEMWRRWRYEHISVEFEMEVHRLAKFMWERKRPWWLQF